MRTPTRPASNAQRFSAAVTASMFALTALAPSAARAQETIVSPDGKGIIGGALLAPEVGTIIMSIAGVRSPWAYVITDLVLAAGGAVAGWEIEHQVETNGWDVRTPVFMLAGGIGLIIPAVVLTLNATRYRPSENASEDRAPTNSPPANPGAPGGSIVAPSAPPPPPPSTPSTTGPSSAAPDHENGVHLSLLDVNARGMHLGVPMPEVRPLFSTGEMHQYGLTQQTEVRMSLVKVAF